MIEKLFSGKNVLIMGAHPDDELGCAGMIHQMTKYNIAIYHYYFSPCLQSLESIGLPQTQLFDECNQSRRTLGINLEKCGNFDYPVRYFPTYRQEILEDMIRLKNEINPALVCVPNGHDLHQDHHVIFEESVRAFKHVTVLGYEMPWNALTMNHDCMVELSKEDMDVKIKAVQCYKSQMHRNYANIEFYMSLAKVRGVQANVEFAECFEVSRLFL